MYQSHDIHTFQDITPKLTRSNWLSWERYLRDIAKKRGLYNTITVFVWISSPLLPIPPLL